MTFVITPPCLADYSCVEACPADAIGPRPDSPEFLTTEQLYIDPARCIDCEACVEACPVGAIFAGGEQFSYRRGWRWPLSGCFIRVSFVLVVRARFLSVARSYSRQGPSGIPGRPGRWVRSRLADRT
jgi:ferredoxin